VGFRGNLARTARSQDRPSVGFFDNRTEEVPEKIQPWYTGPTFRSAVRPEKDGEGLISRIVCSVYEVLRGWIVEAIYRIAPPQWRETTTTDPADKR
jgi:hypothetical protein